MAAGQSASSAYGPGIGPACQAGFLLLARVRIGDRSGGQFPPLGGLW